MLNLENLKTEIHNKLLNLRNMEHYLDTPKFNETYKVADSTEKRQLRHLGKNLNLFGLKAMINSIYNKKYEIWTVRELRNKAKDLGFLYVNDMAKSVLITIMEDNL